MRGFAALIALVILLAIGLSLLVLPSGEQVGIMLLRDREYDQARSYFEKQIDAGDLSAPTVSALLKIYIEYGDVERAIALVERYEDVTGQSAAILSQLAELYRTDRQFGLYLRTMAQLAAVEPTQERLETLADAYFKAGDIEAQIATLLKLRDLGLISAERLIELSDLLVTTGQYDQAIVMLSEALARDPSKLDWSQRMSLFDLMLHRGRTQQALDLLPGWTDETTPDQVLISLAQTAIAYNQIDAAIRILESRPALETTNQNWRSTLAYALRRDGRDEAAWTRMRTWWRDRILPLTSAADLVELALRNKDLDLALDVVDQLGLEMLGPMPVLGLVAELHRAGRTETVDRLLAQIGPEALEDAPVLAAEIWLAREDPSAASRYADIALARLDGDGSGNRALPLDERVALAGVLNALGRTEAAFDILAAQMTDPALPAEGMILLGELYAKLDLAEDGFWDITALLARQNSPRLRAVWANLALLTDRRDVVLEWLGRELDITPTVLTDLYYLAENRGAWDIAVSAAKRLVLATPGDESSLRLAYALFSLGDLQTALTVVAPVVARNEEAEPLYADVLRGLGRTEALIGLWRLQIARPGISAERREELVYALLEAGADDAVFLDLRDYATQRGGFWWSTLAQSALRLGRMDDLVPTMIDRIKTGDPASDETASVLYALADVDRAAALPAYRDLADRAPKLWADSYLSALRDLGRIDELVAWTTDQLGKQTDTQEALALAYALADMTTPEMAARGIEPLAGNSEELAGLYTDLLRRAGRSKDALAFEIEMATSNAFGADFTRGVAFRALEGGDRKTAERLFRTIAGTASPNSETMKQLFYLWGPRPRPEVLDWIEARAKATSGTERQAWLDKLLELRAGTRTAEVIGGVDGAETESELVRLVRALAQDRTKGRDTKTLRGALAKAIERVKQPELLRELAQIAEQIRDRGLVRKAWQAVLAVAPKDPIAHRSLGLAAYGEGRLIDAEQHLGAYLSQGDGDYEANYFFGDTLTRTNRKPQAVPFFKKAQAQLLAKPKRDFQEEVARANLLRRLGKIEDAVKVMEGLLTQRPTDRALRADLADLLIEKGDLRRARDVLGRK
jgi:tetratricopeptide (TPR) repeat protein